MLHFGRFLTSFSKSDCKNDNKKYIECGSHTQPEDCSGSNCVAGYMREHKLFPDYSKSSNRSIFPFLSNKTNDAIKNAAWLRYKIRNEIRKVADKIFELNPYTDVDLLVKRLTGYNKNHYYFAVGEIIDTEMLYAKVTVPYPNQIIVEMILKKELNDVINRVNLNDWFSVQDDEKSYSIDIDETYHINSNEKAEINLHITEKLNDSAEISIKCGANDFFHILKQ